MSWSQIVKKEKVMKNLNAFINESLSNKIVNNVIVRVGQNDKIICDIKKSNENRVLTDHTLFDMASVTKIIVTTSLALIAIDKGLIKTSDLVSKFYDVPEDKKQMTIFNLLTHTMGIMGISLLDSNGNYDEIGEYILSLDLHLPIGSNVRYSCPGFILLGKILEKVYGERLDKAFIKNVAKPLSMNESSYLPDRSLDIVNGNVLDGEEGLVADKNCRYLGGVCGNAGLFSNLNDVTKYTKTLLNYGAPLISKETFDVAIQNHTPNMIESRGLGFLYIDERYKQTGGLFPNGSIGHCGHTGQSIFVNLKTGLYVIVLSDATRSCYKKFTEDQYAKVKVFRHDLHQAIKLDLGL